MYIRKLRLLNMNYDPQVKVNIDRFVKICYKIMRF